MPNIYHTPTIFLPASDKRRAIRAALESHQQQTQANTLGPTVREPYEKKYHVTEGEVDEMRRLRAQDPDKWSNTALAKKFECSRTFASIVIRGLAKEKGEEQKMVKRVIESNRGVKRRVAREDRLIRREKWLRDA